MCVSGGGVHARYIKRLFFLIGVFKCVGEGGGEERCSRVCFCLVGRGVVVDRSNKNNSLYICPSQSWSFSGIR